MNKMDTYSGDVVIKVIGVGGGGNNAVNKMIAENVSDVEYININTDVQTLSKSSAPTKVNIGEKVTHGQGAGSNPELGRKSADDSSDEIKKVISGANMVFITAGMGGGTGTGAAPVVAKIAKDMGILTVAIVTKPFNFEGKHRMKQAEDGIANLAACVDSLIVIPNQKLTLLSDKKISFMSAFQEADAILLNGVASISDLIVKEGYINLDFADVCTVMKDAGIAHMGVGSAKGKDKAEFAAKMAMSSPLLETDIKGAKGVVLNITASPDISLDEIDIAASMVTSQASENATVIFGVMIDPSLEDEMKITLIAAGFDKNEEAKSSGAVNNTVDSKKKENSDESSDSKFDDEINEIFSYLKKK